MSRSTITPPSGIEIKEAGFNSGNWNGDGNPITYIIPIGQTEVPSKTIYARLSSSASTGSLNDNIACTHINLNFGGQTANPVNVSVAGTVSPSGALYVSTTGNDISGNGTNGSPYATLSKALSVASSCSSTINVAAGTYTDDLLDLTSTAMMGCRLLEQAWVVRYSIKVVQIILWRLRVRLIRLRLVI